jgi:uncharacterized caspase-like protein
MLNRIVLLFSLFAAAMLAATNANAERRVALVVGNSDYAQAATLHNPRNDASDLAAALKKLGFEVVLGLDLDHQRFADTIDQFARLLDDADVGLFFYAGHGLQLDEKNYLVSTNAKLDSEFLVSAETIELNAIVRLMESKAPVNLVFLDACRNNPMADNLKRNLASLKRSTALGRGLARIEPSGHDTLVAFAAAPGQEAADGGDRNSPFTAALLKYIAQPGLEVSVMLKQVAADVRRDTRNEQRPQQVSDMSRTFYFAKAETKPEAVAAAKTDADPARAATLPSNGDAGNRELDIAYWNSAQLQGDCDAVHAYLQRFPQGNFVELARLSERRLCDSSRRAAMPDAAPATQASSAVAAAQPPAVVVQPPQSVAQQPVAVQPTSAKSDTAAEPAASGSTKPVPSNTVTVATEPAPPASDPSAGPNSTLTVTALTPPHEVEASAGAPELNVLGPDLARKIQVELARVGCGDLKADGKWRSATRQAVRHFNAEAKGSFDVHEPSLALMTALRAHDQRVCPLECDSGFEVQGDTCVATKAEAPPKRPRGSRASDRQAGNQWQPFRWPAVDNSQLRLRSNRPCRTNPGFGRYGPC